jgi:hypothetical protein
MATHLILAQRRELVALAGGLEHGEQPERLLYAFPHVIEWFEQVLPKLPPLMGDGRQSPLEQVDDLTHDFVAGKDFSFYERSRSMKRDQGVWELKTPDVSLFGWFHVRDSFIIANADSAERIKQHDLYHGYWNDTVRRRDLLDLDEPKFIEGNYSDVL